MEYYNDEPNATLTDSGLFKSEIKIIGNTNNDIKMLDVRC